MAPHPSSGSLRDPSHAKRRLRATLLHRRAALDAAERERADRLIEARVLTLDEVKRAPVILSYVSVADEVSTRGIMSALLATGSQLAIPRCAGAHELRFHTMRSLSDLAPGAFGIPEPADAAATLLDAGALPADAVAMVPALAFDRRGFRIGYGGGYFDAFLASFPGISIGLARDAFVFNDLSSDGALDSWDMPVSMIVTEHETLRCG